MPYSFKHHFEHGRENIKVTPSCHVRTHICTELKKKRAKFPYTNWWAKSPTVWRRKVQRHFLRIHRNNAGSWMGILEVAAAAQAFNICIYVFREGSPVGVYNVKGEGDPCCLWNTPGHWGYLQTNKVENVKVLKAFGNEEGGYTGNQGGELVFDINEYGVVEHAFTHEEVVMSLGNVRSHDEQDQCMDLEERRAESVLRVLQKKDKPPPSKTANNTPAIATVNNPSPNNSTGNQRGTWACTPCGLWMSQTIKQCTICKAPKPKEPPKHKSSEHSRKAQSMLSKGGAPTRPGYYQPPSRRRTRKGRKPKPNTCKQ